jgi:hypothetical protein
LRWTAGGGAALAGVALTGAARPKGVAAQTPASIVGSWIITFPDGLDDPNAHQVTSFTADGIMINGGPPSSPPSTSGGPPTRLYTTVGLGAWTQIAGGQFRATFAQAEVDESGTFSDLVKVVATVGVTGNTFTGSFTVLVTDAGGNVLFDSMGPAGHVNGTRIVA